jgi:hypothetical protein
MTRIRSAFHHVLVAAVAVTALLTVAAPAGAITGGTEDTPGHR